MKIHTERDGNLVYARAEVTAPFIAVFVPNSEMPANPWHLSAKWDSWQTSTNPLFEKFTGPGLVLTKGLGQHDLPKTLRYREKLDALGILGLEANSAVLLCPDPSLFHINGYDFSPRKLECLVQSVEAISWRGPPYAPTPFHAYTKLLLELANAACDGKLDVVYGRSRPEFAEENSNDSPMFGDHPLSEHDVKLLEHFNGWPTRRRDDYRYQNRTPTSFSVLCGGTGISQLGSWKNRQYEPPPDGVEIGFSSHAFTTEQEAAAFILGMSHGRGWQAFDRLSATDTSRRIEFSTATSHETRTYQFIDKAEALAFDSGLETVAGWSDATVLQPVDAADILAAKERQAPARQPEKSSTAALPHVSTDRNADMTQSSDTNSAPITVHILGGKLGISQLNDWEDRHDEPLPDEIDIGFSSYEFASEQEAAAFRKGVNEGTGWLGFECLSATDTSRRFRFGKTKPYTTRTYRFSAKGEAEAFDLGLEKAEGWSEMIILELGDAADILAAKERQVVPAP